MRLKRILCGVFSLFFPSIASSFLSMPNLSKFNFKPLLKVTQIVVSKSFYVVIKVSFFVSSPVNNI